MAAFGDQYILSSGKTGQDRLRMLCEIHDPATRKLLTAAGLGPAHRYAEFGCGLGYVARWAATRAAHVTAIDLSEEHLAGARQIASGDGQTNIEFRNASIYEHGIPHDSLDYSYSRWLLVHLNRPVDAMRSIYAALKPGGTMVCEEADISVVYTEPPSEAYHAFRDLGILAGQKRGVSYEGGRRLHVWAAEAGFEVVAVDAYQPHFLTGRHKPFWSWTFMEAGPAMVEAGLLTNERLAELEAGMKAADDDPGVLVGHCRTHQLIARKPA